MNFELHYDFISGCTLDLSWGGGGGGGAIMLFFSTGGRNCSVAPPGYGPGSSLINFPGGTRTDQQKISGSPGRLLLQLYTFSL